MKKLVLILSVFVSYLSLGQDIHFSQWMFSPLNLNPGETGAYEGDYRVVGNYRSQWGAVMEKQYKTFGMSYDQNFSIYGKSLSAGLQFNNDRSSIGNLMQNKLMFSLGSKKQVKKKTKPATQTVRMVFRPEGAFRPVLHFNCPPLAPPGVRNGCHGSTDPP